MLIELTVMPVRLTQPELGKLLRSDSVNAMAPLSLVLMAMAGYMRKRPERPITARVKRVAVRFPFAICGVKAKYSTTSMLLPLSSLIAELSVAQRLPFTYSAEELVSFPASSCSTGSPRDAPSGWKPFFCGTPKFGKTYCCVLTAVVLNCRFGLGVSRELVLVNAQTAMWWPLLPETLELAKDSVPPLLSTGVCPGGGAIEPDAAQAEIAEAYAALDQ